MVYEFNGSPLGDGLYFFYASWNSKCNVLSERITKLNLDFKNMNIYKINITKHVNMKRQFQVNKIPSYIWIKDGKAVSRRDGNIDYYSLKIWLKERMD